MTVQSITIQLPERVYNQVAQRARRKQRSIEDEVSAVVVDTLPVQDELPAEFGDELAQLNFLNDTELWQAAQTTLLPAESTQMQALIIKQQHQGLTKYEQRKAEALVQRYNRTLLVRAQAALLLKQRGYTIDTLYPTDESAE